MTDINNDNSKNSIEIKDNIINNNTNDSTKLKNTSLHSSSKNSLNSLFKNNFDNLSQLSENESYHQHQNNNLSDLFDDKFYTVRRRNSTSSLKSNISNTIVEEPDSLSLRQSSIDDNSELLNMTKNFKIQRNFSEPPYNRTLRTHSLLLNNRNNLKNIIFPQTEVFESSVESFGSSFSSSKRAHSRKNSRRGWDGELFKITILKLNHNDELTQPFVKISLGDRTYQTQISQDPEGNWNESFTFYITYHDQLFNTLQIDVFNNRWLLPALHKGRAEIRLFDLNSLPNKFTLYYELYRREVALGALSQWAKQNKHYPNVGAVQVKIEYNYISLENNDEDVGDLASVEDKVLASDAHFTKLDRASHLIEASELWETLSQPTIHPKLDDTTSALHTVGSYIVSKPTLTLLKGVAKVYYSFQQGLELSTLEFLTGVTILEKYFRLYSNKQIEGELIKQYSDIEVFVDYYPYALAAYGWAGILISGKLPPFINGKPPTDQSAILNYLHLSEDKLLGYEFLDNQVFRPNYFICLDSKGDLVLSIRGTLSAMDTLTDLVCEYKPWKGGLVHGGILAAATWFMTSVVPALMCHAVNHQVKTIYIVGHSLGGGTASILSILLHDHFRVAHLPLDHQIKLKCFAYGPPPCVTKQLAESYTDLITSIVNGDDVASTLCYGGLMDFKSLVLAAVEASKEVGFGWGLGLPFSDPSPDDAKWKALCNQLDASRDHMNLTPDHYPKLYIPGKILRIKTVTEAPENYQWNRSALLTKEQILNLQKSGKKLNSIGQPSKFAFVEHLPNDSIIEMRVSLTMLLNHVTNVYEEAFQLVRDTMLGGSFGSDGDVTMLEGIGESEESIPMKRINSRREGEKEDNRLSLEEEEQVLIAETQQI